MPEYDFQSLSSRDFELLVRDLLQEELKLRLETFGRGRDGGRDFRFRSKSGDLVVQCKHYPSGYDALHRVLKRDERPKVQKLKPSRYLLAVSTSLTPHRKDQLLALFTPYCNGPADIYGKDDLNNLLGLYPEIEQKHLKLWLTSEAVLTKVINAGIWGDTELTVQRIRARTRRYVLNPSLGRARELLDKHHCCVIAGIPGIGKTTLAEILLIDHVDLHEFQAIRIANDLSEIKAIKDPKRRQFFYFDDFLGKTGLDKLQKNEDQRLVEFMDQVAENPNWRFVLTTREYILNAAQMRYEALAYSGIDFTRCIIALADYSHPIRAEILYNHIYFSDLPDAYKRGLLAGRRYYEILRHKNYNPRIIDHMTQHRNVTHVQPEAFFADFLQNLSNPVQVWNHAFRYQLSEPARHLLLVMGSLPDEVLVGDLEVAFASFCKYRRQELGLRVSSSDFHNALKELDGNFVSTSVAGTDQIATFHNPSVRDFLEYYLDGSPQDVKDLVCGSHFWDQLMELWRGRRGSAFRGVREYGPKYLEHIEKLLAAPCCALQRRRDDVGNVTGAVKPDTSFERRAMFAFQVAQSLTLDDTELADRLFAAVTERIGHKDADRGDVVRLLQTRAAQRQGGLMLAAAKEYLVGGLQDFDAFDSLGAFVEAFPEAINAEALENLATAYAEFCEDYAQGWGDDPDVLRSVAGDIARVGRQLDADVARFSTRLRSDADYAEEQIKESYEPDDEPDGEQWRSSTDRLETVDSMFDDLLSEIDERA